MVCWYNNYASKRRAAMFVVVVVVFFVFWGGFIWVFLGEMIALNDTNGSGLSLLSLSQYLAVDVRRLNVSLLRWFREGVAAALGVPVGHVHINQLNVRCQSITRCSPAVHLTA